MFYFTKRNTVIGLIGFVASIALFFLLVQLSGASAIYELSPLFAFLRILSFCLISIGIGFFGFIFFKKAGFFMLFLPVISLCTLSLILEFSYKTSTDLTLAILSAVSCAVLSFIFISNFMLNKISTYCYALKTKIEEQQLTDTESTKLKKQDEKLKDDTRPLNQSIIISNSNVGTIYQLINKNDCYYFNKIGTSLNGLEEEKLITDFDEIESTFIEDNDNYKILYKDIIFIKCYESNHSQPISFDNIKIKTRPDTKTFSLINDITKEKLQSFFGDKTTIVSKTNEQEEKFEIKDKEKLAFLKINVCLLVYSLISTVLFCFYIFFSTESTNLLLTTICTVLAVLPTISYFLFNKYFSFNDYLTIKSDNKCRLSIKQIAFVFPALLAIKCLLNLHEFIYFNTLKFVLFSLAFIVVAVILFFFLTKEHKKVKSVIASFILIIILLCPAVIYKIDTVFYTAEPEEVACELLEKSTLVDSNERLHCYFTIEYKEREIKYEVSTVIYNQFNAHQKVTIEVYRGVLSIEYAIDSKKEYIILM